MLTYNATCVEAHHFSFNVFYSVKGSNEIMTTTDYDYTDY